jgi:hypothetical protein
MARVGEQAEEADAVLQRGGGEFVALEEFLERVKHAQDEAVLLAQDAGGRVAGHVMYQNAREAVAEDVPMVPARPGAPQDTRQGRSQW